MYKVFGRAALVACACSLLFGCAAFDKVLRTEGLRDGPGLQFKAEEVAAFKKNEDDVLTQLYGAAELKGAPTTNTEWGRVIFAGMGYADEKCEAYMHSLL